MKKILLTLFLIPVVSLVFAQSIANNWYGALSIPGRASVRIIFHIVKNGDVYTTTFDSPDQGANGLPTDKTTVNGNAVVIDASKFGISYTGTFIADSNKINGVFKQGGLGLTLNLTTNNENFKPAPTVTRPQDPKDFPYKQEDVVFTNTIDSDMLAGTLTMPADGKASKIVVLITGSGPQNRNEELLGHRPFLVWSDWLTRQGIAVLRYDDRGIGKSTGVFSSTTTAGFANDAEAAVNYILSRADLKNLKIGLMGHSEGGIIAPMVASRNKAVKFMVLLAGPGVPVIQLMSKQTEDQLRVNGAPANVIKRSAALNKKLYELVLQNPSLSTAQLKQKADTLLYHDLSAYPAAEMNGKTINQITNEAEASLLTPWFRYFVAINPADYLVKVRCPVLALNGTKDMQVNAEANLAGIKESLEKGGNKHFDVIPLNGLNHLFQQAGTGSLAEYGKIEETVNPIALTKVSVWINKL